VNFVRGASAPGNRRQVEAGEPVRVAEDVVKAAATRPVFELRFPEASETPR
jgi:hypothetical protein